MSTTQEPEAEVTPPVQPEGSQPAETNGTVTPQTIQPTDPPIRREYVTALEETLRENNRRIQQLQDQVEQVSRRPVVQQQEPTEVDRNEFFNDPHKHTRSIVADELSKQIKPLIEFVGQMPRPQNDSLKNRIKFSPQYARFFADPLVEQAYDAVMQSVPNPTEQSAIAAANQVIGWQATGQLRQVLGLPDVPAAPPPQSPQVTMPNNPAPPYQPPTAPATPRTQPKQQMREFTENERRIMRERNMTPEQFLEWMDVPASQVVNSKIGRNG